MEIYFILENALKNMKLYIIYINLYNFLHHCCVIFLKFLATHVTSVIRWFCLLHATIRSQFIF